MPDAVLDGSIVDRVDLQSDLVILPIRHHSPACAWQVAGVLRAHRPDVVLIEGPSDANDKIPRLVDPRTAPPVAIYCFSRRGEDRLQCWYPFCENSPEYVALTTASQLGFASAFIDIPSSWREIGDKTGSAKQNPYADQELRHHAFLDELCRRARTRDFDELWDRLFESDGFERPADPFFEGIATYCRIARAYSDPMLFDRDGTSVRERYMAGCIQEHRAAGRRVVVVCGGFHRAGLMELLAGPLEPPSAPPAADQVGIYLVAYGESALSTWSGYQSGMPGPAFYRTLWRSVSRGDSSSRSHHAMLRILRRTASRRSSQDDSVSTADVIAADAQARRLARFRGHQRVTRDDLRDAVASTWVKTAVDADTRGVLDRVRRAFTGDAIGKVTPDAGLPPLVHDFQNQLDRLELGTLGERSKGRTIFLDIYAHRRHRLRSAFLHQLEELRIPFARQTAGPRFVTQEELRRVRESWDLRWSAKVDAALIEQSSLGDCVFDAAMNHLLQRARSDGASPSASDAVAMLSQGFLMGMPRLVDDLGSLVRDALWAEGSFASIAEAFSRLVRLVKYQPVLGADEDPDVRSLARTSFERAIELLDTLPGLVAAGIPGGGEGLYASPELSGLARLREAVLARALPELDVELFHEALDRLEPRLGACPLLEGAVLGVLRQCGRRDDGAIRRRVQAAIHNTATQEHQALGEFLRGLFETCRQAILENTGLFEAVADGIATLNQDAFARSLPTLRLAFSPFTPPEIRRLARRIHRATVPAGKGAAESESTQADLRAQRVDDVVATSLRRWEL